jgi:hypothetical protein
VGGDTVESAVLAVFAALIWHTQQLREDLQKFIGKNKNIITQKCTVLFKDDDVYQEQKYLKKCKLKRKEECGRVVTGV